MAPSYFYYLTYREEDWERVGAVIRRVQLCPALPRQGGHTHPAVIFGLFVPTSISSLLQINNKVTQSLFLRVLEPPVINDNSTRR